MEGSELYLKKAKPSSSVPRNYPDLRDHLAALDDKGLLRRVDRPINKDTEIHPLVRWQYRGGIEPEDRKAWLFEQPTDTKGKKYDIPVAIAALAANEDVYLTGLGVDSVEDLGPKWAHAINNRIVPEVVDEGACQEVGRQGDELRAALVLGGPPAVSYAAVQKVPYGVDELSVAGGLAGEAIRTVKCKTVPLVVPAEAEIVIEGYINTDYYE